MAGLYRNPTEDSFVSDAQILYEATLALPHQPPKFETPLPQPRSREYWNARMLERQRIFLDESDDPNVLEVSFDVMPYIALSSDWHVQGEHTNYQRIIEEVDKVVATPNAYMWVLGDMINNFFWMPAGAREIEPNREAHKFVHAQLRLLADHKKLLCVTVGNHDKWSERTGEDPYRFFAEEFGTHYTHGDVYMYVNARQQRYKILANHRWPGSSIYNNSHPEIRAGRSVEGADVIVGGHWHTKGVNEQPVREFGNTARRVVHIALGTYKASDDYTRDKGFTRRIDEEMFGSAIALHDAKHMVKPFYDIIEGCEEFSYFNAQRNKVAIEV